MLPTESGWKVRVGLVDDHALFRAGLAAVLSKEPDIEVVGEAANRDEALALVRSQALDLAIIDVLMPGCSGISIAYEIRDAAPSCRILGLSVIDDAGLVANMLRAGAVGFALKSQTPAEIAGAIRQVTGGVRYLPPSVSGETVDAELGTEPQPALQRLTKREREIFELLIRGYSNHEIATRLFIALRTVETHRQRVMKKLSSRSILEMHRLAVRHGGI